MVAAADSGVHEEKVENGPGSKILFHTEGESGEVREGWGSKGRWKN